MTAKQFKAERTRLGLTQVELAKWLKVTENTVTRWETNQRAIPPMAEVALEYVKITAKPARKAAA